MEHSRATEENENLRRDLERIMHETEEAEQYTKEQEDLNRKLSEEIERLTAQEGVLTEEGHWLERQLQEQERVARELEMVLDRQEQGLEVLLAGQERISAAAEAQKRRQALWDRIGDADSGLTELRRKEPAQRVLESPHAHADGQSEEHEKYGRRDSADLG